MVYQDNLHARIFRVNIKLIFPIAYFIPAIILEPIYCHHRVKQEFATTGRNIVLILFFILAIPMEDKILRLLEFGFFLGFQFPADRLLNFFFFASIGITVVALSAQSNDCIEVKKRSADYYHNLLFKICQFAIKKKRKTINILRNFTKSNIRYSQTMPPIIAKISIMNIVNPIISVSLCCEKFIITFTKAQSNIQQKSN